MAPSSSDLTVYATDGRRHLDRLSSVEEPVQARKTSSARKRSTLAPARRGIRGPQTSQANRGLPRVRRYQWARIALGLNLLGTILLVFALQIGSSEVRLVTVNGATAICRGDRTLFMLSPAGGIAIGSYCPPTIGEDAAIVKTDHPRWLGAGLVLIAFSSVIGIFWGEGTEERRNRSERRRQLRLDFKRSRGPNY